MNNTPAHRPSSNPSDDFDTRFDLCYWLDVGDIIVDISGGWDDFAEANAGDGLEPRRVIGRSLLSFVHGDVTKMYVRTLIQSARLTRRPLVKTYRCDSPDARRFMEMRLCMEDSGLLRWEHRLLRSEPLAHRLAFRVVNAAPKARCVVRCSMCNRLKQGTAWREPDQAVPPEQRLDEAIPVIYGVCPNCLSIPHGIHAR